ncbi:hypothetical protein [Vibrio paracholerae]|uniref:hypothetical protein n=1 Tax=Vibrio paracholerae TaxID=650003 RepID=UPI001F25249A|nr:hypothetical protein [Vibrio paracholerae]
MADDRIFPFLVEAAAVLATFVHPNHVFIYAYGDELTLQWYSKFGRLPATPSCLGIHH